MAVKTFIDNTSLPASDINTYLANSGLVYIKEQTVGAAVSTVTVLNAFSATYDNYEIIYTGGVGSATIVLGLQIGNGATMNTSYTGTAAYTNVGAAAFQIIVDNPATSASNVGGVTTTNAYLQTKIMQPFLAKNTSFFGQYIVSDFGRFGFHSYAQLSNTSFDSLKILTNTGTITGGTITIYGYRKA